MKEFILLRKKTYSYLIEDGKEDRKAQGTKKFAIKRKLKPKSYKTFLEATQAENKLNQLGKKLAQIILNKIINNLLKAIN